MERLYLTRGFSDSEMAEHLGVNRSTTFRDRAEIERRIPIHQDEDGRYRILRASYISELRLNLAEALGLYLAARRASQQTRHAHEHVANAIQKLSTALRQPMTERLVRAADTILRQHQVPDREPIFATIAQAWADSRRIKLEYRALRDGQLRTHRFEPYLLEPSPWSDGVYLIGRSDIMHGIATLKLDRIVKANLLGPFDLPTDFDEDALLRHAWGIWGSHDDPHTVILHFAPGQAARRVQETVWHPLQQTDPLPDGGLRWQAPIAEWQEMLPWIRGWGADIEVIAPPELREVAAREVANMNSIYQARSVSSSPYHALYAKTARTDERVHKLLYHLLDVGQVTLRLWEDSLSTSTRQWLADLLQVDTDAAGRFVAFIAALHDLGKAGPAFQHKYAGPALRRRLAQAGFALVHPDYSADTQQQVPHGTVSTWAMAPLLIEYQGIPKRFARALATAVGGHHGAWPGPTSIDRLDDSICPVWDQARRDLFYEVRSVFQPPTVQMPTEKIERNALLTVLTAITSVADWIGSREEDFPFEDAPLPTRVYAERTAQQARAAISHLGWATIATDSTLKSLTDLFPEIPAPNHIQDATLNAAAHTTLPALVILEAPTGIGKTEAALTLTDVWIRRGQLRGLYVAMPTQATSNQMFDRVVKYLELSRPTGLVNINLAHSQAYLNETMLHLRLTTIGEGDTDHVAAMSWFIEQSKRTLLAPYGVGTVDQALLSILQTKHFFVRLFGLHNKVVVFDEVHAYDTYMSTLLDRLLVWLRALGTSVVILSATLPEETRQRLVKAYTGKTIDDANTYPQLTVAPADTIPHALALPAPDDTLLEIAWLPDIDVSHLITALLAQIADGGCAAVICNTVRRAQELYLALTELAHPEDTDLMLFHARYPPAWRKTTEDAVLHKFGKPRADQPTARPRRAIVVATQVIEQSLDLDFDIMVSELAPIDLLIQRAGRLQRHNRGPRPHPRRLTILRPPLDENGLPQFGASGFVYAPYILLQSYLTLQSRTHLALPSDTRELIAAVYAPAQPHHADPLWQAALQQSLATLQREKQTAESMAKEVRILAPNSDYLLEQSIRGLEEDDPTVHQSFQARTRDIGPSIGLVLFFETDAGPSLEPDGSLPIDPTQPLTPATIALLDRYVINVRHWAALRHFPEQAPPPSWRKSARLRHCRPVVLGRDGYRFQVEKHAYTIQLSRRLGLQILKEVS